MAQSHRAQRPQELIAHTRHNVSDSTKASLLVGCEAAWETKKQHCGWDIKEQFLVGSGRLDIPLTQPWGWHLWFCVKCLNNYWIDCHEIQYRRSALPQYSQLLVYVLQNQSYSCFHYKETTLLHSPVQQIFFLLNADIKAFINRAGIVFYHLGAKQTVILMEELQYLLSGWLNGRTLCFAVIQINSLNGKRPVIRLFL